MAIGNENIVTISEGGNNRQYHEKDLLAEVLHQAREVKEAFG